MGASSEREVMTAQCSRDMRRGVEVEWRAPRQQSKGGNVGTEGCKSILQYSRGYASFMELVKCIIFDPLSGGKFDFTLERSEFSNGGVCVIGNRTKQRQVRSLISAVA